MPPSCSGFRESARNHEPMSSGVLAYANTTTANEVQAGVHLTWGHRLVQGTVQMTRPEQHRESRDPCREPCT